MKTLAAGYGFLHFSSDLMQITCHECIIRTLTSLFGYDILARKFGAHKETMQCIRNVTKNSEPELEYNV